MNTSTNLPKFSDFSVNTNHIPMSEDRFHRMFNPLPNPFETDTHHRYELHAALLDPHDKRQLHHVKEMRRANPRCVWTLMDVDDQDILMSGYQFAKRVGYCHLGYVISTTPINEDVELYIPLDKKLL